VLFAFCRWPCSDKDADEEKGWEEEEEGAGAELLGNGDEEFAGEFCCFNRQRRVLYMKRPYWKRKCCPCFVSRANHRQSSRYRCSSDMKPWCSFVCEKKIVKIFQL